MKKNEKTLKIKSIISNGEQTVLDESTGVVETVENVRIAFEEDGLPYIKPVTFEDAICNSRSFPAKYVLTMLKSANSALAGIKDFSVECANDLVGDGGTITFEVREYNDGDIVDGTEFHHKAYRYSIIGCELNADAKEYYSENKNSKFSKRFGF